MTVTVYKSTDSSAPVLTGQVGSLIALLDAILRTGYGSKAGEGWTKPYTGTNQAVFRGPSGTNQRYLNVIDDGATTAGAANYARVYGMEAATAQNTGTGLFPTTVQIASPGLYVVKSTTADATARPWFCYANGKMFYLFIATDSGSLNPSMGTLIFGDFTSYVGSDAYNTILIANTTTNGLISSTNNWAACVSAYTAALNLVGHYTARTSTQTGSSAPTYKITNLSLLGIIPANPTTVAQMIGQINNAGNTSPTNGTGLPYPNTPDSGLYAEKCLVGESTGIRGELPGFWCPMHNRPLVHLDTFSGSGSLSGKTFEVLSFDGGNRAMIFMETSNTW